MESETAGLHDLRMGSPERLAFFLTQRLKNPLPGLEAHKLMMPPDRLSRLEQYASEIPQARPGAVALVLFPESNVWNFIAIRRQNRPGDVHSAQVALPGGAVEPGDQRPLFAALREAEEEVGLRINPHQVCGPLTPVYIPPSRFLVHPFLAVLAEKPSFQIQAEEVAEVLVFPVGLLLKNEVRQKADFLTSYGRLKNYPCFRLGDTLIWGATAMILSELAFILTTDHKAFHPNEGH
ncbi:MAG: CoA pyrophosphatase [Flavobacteriales bacterium]|nr:CoA pyrophosphatase [Flavobacteriales bacterium]MCX7649190.1 CoA pyrophosphatase [Flavobacteriales bacterium]MDW8431422.1 CoA pyrophosphatase [Flavobacteriales bacterium]